MLGMHQCSYERTWTEDERALFKDISLRMTDSFSSLLMNRNLRTSERELRKSEEKFRAISDYTYDWESWHGIDGQLLWVNRAVERFTGYSIEECMAMSDYPLPLIHKDDRDNIEKAFRQAVEEKTSVNDLPFRIRRKDVAILWAAVSWQPIYDTTGNHMGLRSSVRDITERKKADERVQESEEKYRSLIGNIPGAAYRCRCDEHWTMEFISDEIEKMTSYPATDFIEHAVRSFFSIIHREDQQRAVDVVTKSVENKESFAIEYRLVTADGNIRWVFEKGQCVVNEQGKATYLDGFILDITGRKQAEKALAEYREHLEAIVAERTRELRASQEKLIHAERLAVMGKFASGIAHEIRNPLGVIDSSVYYLKLLLQDADEETRQQLDRIKLNVTKCTTIIQNLQNLTKMKAPQKVRLDIAAAIADGLAGAQVPQDVKIVQQVAAGELWVDADREQLVMVFKNIVTNAIQAMQYAGTLWVTAGRTGDGEIEVTFEDSGPGIAPEHLEQLFQPFFSTKEKGFGVGLPICKMIIEKHGGTLEAQSEAGQGATFSVRLPIAETKNNRG